MNNKYVEIKADTNDGDYVTERYTLLDGELERYKKVAVDLKEKHGKWPKGEMAGKNDNPSLIYAGILTDEDIEWFNESTPYGEYGIHTIESITILTIIEEEVLF